MTYERLTGSLAQLTTLTVDTVRFDDTMEFVLMGELDLKNAPDLNDLLVRALENRERADAQISHLILDMRALTFIDSSGIRVLIATKRRCIEHGAELTLRVVDSQVKRVLSVAGVADFLGLGC